MTMLARISRDSSRVYYQSETCQDEPLMSDSPSHQEVKEMIDEAFETKGKQSMKAAIKEWQEEYRLGPHHFVWIENQYTKAISRETLIRRIIIASIVTAAITVVWGSAKTWIYQQAIAEMENHQKK